MNVFITGITGLLGKALVEENRGRHCINGIYIGDYEMEDTEHAKYKKADMLRDNAFFEEENIDCIIHTAGVANTDICEDEKFFDMAYASNVHSTEKMARLALRKGAKLVYISSNAVFDGENAPYCEEDKPNPINRYGMIKLKCEDIVRKHVKNYLIIRPIIMYGLSNSEERKSFFMWVLEKLRKKETIHIVNDVFENPLLSNQCSGLIWKLVDKNATGTYHIAGRDVLSRYEAALVIAKIFSLDKSLIKAVPSSFFKNMAKRPKNTSYNTSKIEQESKEAPIGFEEGLRILKDRLECDEMVLNERV